MDRGMFMHPSNTRKMGILGGLTLGLIAFVLSVCCLGATSTVAYADSQSSVGTPASSTEINGITTMAEADEATASFSITGENNQTEARKILDLVNKARADKSVAPLTWDYDLEQAAIQRAAEISIFFDHARPNGKMFNTLLKNGYITAGENIHADAGVSDAESANKGWTNSPGHYANMIDASFTCMAAAMFEVDGITYWVELFGDPNQNTTEVAAINGEKTYSIEAVPSCLDLSFGDGLAVDDKKGTKTQYSILNKNKEWEYSITTINPDSFTWSSSDQNVASIDANGVATVNGDGKVIITATNKALNTVAVSETVTIKTQSSSSTGTTQAKEGWVHSSKGWWYRYSDGSFATGWFSDGKDDYYFDNQGWMKTGWQQIEGDWYYFNGSGALTTGWQKVKGKWYFMDEDGIMLTGKITDAGKTYFLGGNGAMKTGWVKDGSDWYYTNKSGVMVTGWQKVKGTWYYLNNAGVMVSNDFRGIDGKYYHFETSGAMSTGWKHIDGSWYYFASSGAAKQNQWLKSGGKWYYFASDYRMCTGFAEVDGQTYYLNSSGAMVTGWKSIEGKWRYFSKSGVMQTNKWISGKYWVDSDGIMATNAWVDGDKYYVGADGAWKDTRKASTSNTTPSATSKVFWTANGGKYHVSQNCATLKNSSHILSGTIADAGSRERCKVCG